MAETKIYKSKIGLELVIPLIIVLGVTSVLMVLKSAWPGLVINFAVIVFLWYTFTNTFYTIRDKHSIVKCGFFVNETINIDSIKSLVETRNPLSSAAASLDRIEVSYNKYDSVLISPKEKLEFIRHIQSINPNVEVKYRNKK
jgi:hypothetical protein